MPRTEQLGHHSSSGCVPSLTPAAKRALVDTSRHRVGCRGRRADAAPADTLRVERAEDLVGHQPGARRGSHLSGLPSLTTTHTFRAGGDSRGYAWWQRQEHCGSDENSPRRDDVLESELSGVVDVGRDDINVLSRDWTDTIRHGVTALIGVAFAATPSPGRDRESVDQGCAA
jgi:hypothetical protein